MLSYLWTIFHLRKTHSIKINGQIIMNGAQENTIWRKTFWDYVKFLWNLQKSLELTRGALRKIEIKVTFFIKFHLSNSGQTQHQGGTFSVPELFSSSVITYI